MDVVVVVVVKIAVVLFQRGVNFLCIDLRFKTLTNVVLNSKIERVFCIAGTGTQNGQ